MASVFHLFGNGNSGHSYKVALSLALAGQDFAFTAIDLDPPRADRPAAFRDVSRYGEVPVLVIDGEAHCQSDAILLSLTEIVPALAIAPTRRRVVREWLFWEANRIGMSVPNVRHALNWAKDTPPAVVDWLAARARLDLARLDAELGDKAFLLGEAWTVADIACAGYLYWLDEAQLDVGNWPAVAAWLDRIAAIPGWRHPYELLS